MRTIPDCKLSYPAVDLRLAERKEPEKGKIGRILWVEYSHCKTDYRSLIPRYFGAGMPRPVANASSEALCSVALSEESIDQLIEAAHETTEPDNDNNDLKSVDTKDESAQ